MTYNENIASFNVFNMSVILLKDIGVFSTNMQGAVLIALVSNMNRAALGSFLL
jgi:hypothetical protein